MDNYITSFLIKFYTVDYNFMKDSTKRLLLSYLSYTGRISRKDMWIWFGIVYLAAVLCMGITALISFGLLPYLRLISNENSFYAALALFALEAIFFIYLTFCAYSKRLHDRGRSAWFILITFIPIVSIWLFVDCYCLRGVSGPNKYGEDPLQ